MQIQLNDKMKPLQTVNEFKQNQVYNEIKTDILNNTYPAGTVMVERRLCEIYNVSRSPIRNALQQ
jgi:DNA-binding GntR family transcriptional regulator